MLYLSHPHSLHCLRWNVTCMSVTIVMVVLGLCVYQEVQWYFLVRDREGLKWLPVHILWEQLQEKQSRRMKKLTNYRSLENLH